MNIWYGTGENPELSNLAYRPFVAKDNKKYISVEHYYQTNKSGTFVPETYIAYITAGPGKKIIGKNKPNFSTNLNTMYYALKQSFLQNEIAKQALIQTGNAIFTHTQDTGVWREQFPKLLSLVRTELRDSK